MNLIKNHFLNLIIDFKYVYVILNLQSKLTQCRFKWLNVIAIIHLKQIRIDEELLMLEQYKVTPNEFYLIRTLILYPDYPEYLSRYLQLCIKSGIKIRELLISLQNKQVITKAYKIPEPGSPFVAEDVTLNMNFLKNCNKASFDLGRELFEVYPQFAEINGCMVALRSVSKKFDSMEDFFRFYAKSIRYNLELHNRIIDITKWAAENTNIINCSLCNYVVDQKWNDIEALKNGTQGNVNFNTVRVL